MLGICRYGTVPAIYLGGAGTVPTFRNYLLTLILGSKLLLKILGEYLQCFTFQNHCKHETARYHYLRYTTVQTSLLTLRPE